MNTYSKRKNIIIGIFIFTGLIFGIRLFKLQVLDSTYKDIATNNVLREVVQYPARGLIYDRNGELLVHNKPSYDLLVTPRETQTFDTTYLCNLLKITKEDLKNKIKKASDYSTYKPSIIVKQISPEIFAVLQERIYRFKGFHTQSRTLRQYNYPAAAHVLGYVGEVNQSDIEKEKYYRVGDYIGVSGIEKTYEKWLRGNKGIKKYLVDVHNRIQGNFLEGEEDIPAHIGNNITTSIDINLQLYAEKLLQNKKGSVVAIEPSTGEILSLVSAPTYHPDMLVGRARGKNFSKLYADTLKPLFNRALLAEYPPGSTFKVLNVLTALEEKTITTNTYFSCSGPSSTPIRCTHNHITPLRVTDAIRESCNPFLWQTFQSIFSKYSTSAEGYKIWRNHVLKFGIGKKLGIDLPVESKGSLPNIDYYNNIYGKGHWNALTIRSLSIGQGELGVTPLQLANYCAAIANRGYYYIPHVVKKIEDGEIDKKLKKRNSVGISKNHFDPAIEGMQMVVENTNASWLTKINGVTMCGKTGTAENPHGSDHSIFMAFAPKEEPKIAISVYIENGVWGSRYAAPIASLIVEKYLTDSIASNRLWIEKKMLNANLLNSNQPK